MDTAAMFALVGAYSPGDPAEKSARDRTLDFIETHAEPAFRTTLDGHVTASAWVTDPACGSAILIRHRKLDIWIQPGGHVDPTDASLAEAALREAREELGNDRIELADTGVFDIDIHERIPTKGNEPEHVHYDVRFRCVAPDGTIHRADGEILDARWLDCRTIADGAEYQENIRRMARKTIALREALGSSDS